MNGNTSIFGRSWIQIRQKRRSSVTTLSASRFFWCDYTDKALVIVGRSPGVHSQNRGCSGLSIDDADLQKRFDIQVREISSNVISEQLHVLGAGCKLRGGLGSHRESVPPKQNHLHWNMEETCRATSAPGPASDR